MKVRCVYYNLTLENLSCTGNKSNCLESLKAQLDFPISGQGSGEAKGDNCRNVILYNAVFDLAYLAINSTGSRCSTNC